MRISVQWLTGNDNKPKGLWPIEWLAITYSILTTLAMFVLWPDMDHPRDMLADRLYIFLGTILLWRIYLFWPRRLMTFIRITAQMALLSYWYPDTYEFNRTFPNLDHIFARWDAVLFSCQPSLEFSRLCPWPWFSEAGFVPVWLWLPGLYWNVHRNDTMGDSRSARRKNCRL